MTISGTNGFSRTTATGRRGVFTFGDVEAGYSYTITIGSRRYFYVPQVITVYDSVTDLEFYPE